MGTKVAIDAIPIGSRVIGENPKEWDYDSSLPELDGSWLVAKMSVKKDNGIWVDVEMIRPAAFWHRAGAFAGGQIMLTFAELEISNLAKIHSLEPTPPIAIGEGNVVTARMTTRQTHQLVRAQFSDQTTLIGTPAHPIWSVSEADWVELEELKEGDLVLGESGPLEVVSTELIETLEPVYNLEVYGEHVYLVENSGIFVHNGRRLGYKGPKAKRVHARRKFLGGTPGKDSPTGRVVQATRRADGTLIGEGAKAKFKHNNKWYSINDADMGHIRDAVRYWNRYSRRTGARSAAVRK